MKKITIFSGATGLNTVDDPARLKKGELQVAVNIKIDPSGRPSRRKGYSEITSGSFHSLFYDGNDCLVVSDSTLYLIGSDKSLTAIKAGLASNDRMAYTTVNSRTYYSNGVDYGFVEDGVNNTWAADTYTGPTTDREFSGPFPGHHLAFYKGRLFVAVDKVLVRSEMYSAGLFCFGDRAEQFKSRIRMIKSVAGGLFVSTDQEIFFRTDTSIEHGDIDKVANFPAVEWSESIEYVEGADIGFKSPGLCALWASPEGAILGTPSGSIINLTKKKVVYPKNVRTGFGCLKGYNFIHGME